MDDSNNNMKFTKETAVSLGGALLGFLIVAYLHFKFGNLYSDFLEEHQFLPSIMGLSVGVFISFCMLESDRFGETIAVCVTKS